MKSPKDDIVFNAGQDGKLLETVRKELAHLPSGRVKSYLEHRMISVDGVVTGRFDYPVKNGQTIRIRRSKATFYSLPFPVLYEDDYIIAVNKPSGLLSVANEKEKENTAVRLLRDCGSGPVYVVHRLDRDTSGVLLFAKDAATHDRLKNSWDELVRKREYLAVCEGVFEKKSGRCESLLRETDGHVVYSAKYGEGKPAVTNYEVIGDNGSYSLLRVLIETGRKNQIRVHMKELGHPVAGDKKYGARANPLGRLGLHASELELIHPATGKVLSIKAPAGRRFRLPK